MSVSVAQVKDLKMGRYVVIDNEPCKITSIQKSKPGKHGSAKCRVEGISEFSGGKKTLLKSVDHSCEIPELLKTKAQVIANLGNNRLQLMDLESYETYELEVKPEYGNLQSGKEVDVQELMGRKMVTHAKKD